MEIEDIQRIYREYGATITDHANQRMMERDIEPIEIRDATMEKLSKMTSRQSHIHVI